MNGRYHYTQTGLALVAEIDELLSRGGLAVVMGARQIGKSTLLMRVAECRARRGSPTGLVRFPAGDQPPPAAADVPGAEPIPPGPDRILEWIDRHADPHADAALFVLDLDAAGPRPRTLFDELIARRARQPFALAISAAFDPLAACDSPAARDARGFVIQGLGAEDFAEAFRRIDEATGGRLREQHEPGALLRETGGNPFFLNHARIDALHDKDGGRHASLAGLGRSQRDERRRYVTEAIEPDPSAVRELEDLIGQRWLPAFLDEPGPLELAGIAARAEGRLKFSSPCVERAALEHYTPRRFAALYALFGDWDRAWPRLAALSAEERVRPRSEAERPDAERMVGLLCERMQAAAARPDASTDEVERMFVDGCHYVLGLPDVVLLHWDRPDRARKAAWQTESYATAAGYTSGPRRKVRLPDPGSLDVTPEPHAVWADYVTDRTKRRRCLVRNIEDRPIDEPGRRALTERLLRGFILAHDAATSTRRVRSRIERRDRHLALIAELYDRLGTPGFDRPTLLGRIAKKLRKTCEYRRVLICMADANRDRLRVESESVVRPVAPIADVLPEWSLRGDLVDIQQLVVLMNRPEVVIDSLGHQRTNKEAVRLGNMKAGAVVPIATEVPGSEAVGTLHVERLDQKIPELDEIDDLILFGRQLAVVLELVEGTRLLFGGLDEFRDSVLIVDRRSRLLYLNQTAANTIFSGSSRVQSALVRAGWQKRTRRPRLVDLVPPRGPLWEFSQLIDKAFKKGRTIGDSLPGADGGPMSEYFAVAHILRDPTNSGAGSGTPVAAFAQLENHSFLNGIVKAIRKAQKNRDTESIIRAVFEALGSISESGWLHRMERAADGEHLVIRDAFSIKDRILLEQMRNDGHRLPPRASARPHTYLALNEKRPIAFYSRDADAGEPIRPYNEAGLKIHPADRQDFPDGYRAGRGDSWIDFPLFGPDAELGKITLDCDQRFTPENFYFLRLFSEIVSDLLHVSRLWDDGTKFAAQVNKSFTAHTLKNQIVPLRSLLSLYRTKEGRCPEIRTLNDRFDERCKKLAQTFEMAHFFLAPVTDRLRREEVDLVALVRETLFEQCSPLLPTPPARWEIAAPASLSTYVDPTLLNRGFAELVSNSLRAFEGGPPGSIRVDIALEVRHGVDWVRVVYADDGPGIPDHNKCNIFNDFFSRWSGRRISTGLGMSFLHRVIVAHGGEIEERGTFGDRGTPGVGAKFVITIPRDPPSPDQE